MATAAQQQAFASQYGPYAQQAGTKLGVDPNIILGQWGMETGWQTPSSGNLAGISPGGKIASYSSPQAFTDSYVSTIQNNFPNATNTGSDANAFNQGLVNGKYGVYYQGNDAASKGLSTPTAYDQSSYLASLQSAQNHNLIQYSSGTANGTQIASGDTTNQGFGSNGSPDNMPTVTVTPHGSSTNWSGSSPGGTTAGSGSPTSTSSQPGLGTGAEIGYTPPASTGGPSTIGLGPGVAQQANTIAQNATNTFTNAVGGWFSDLENELGRFGLIIVAVVLLLIALWRIMDPSGEKTRSVMHGAMVAA